jgi:hypothetical protein
MARLTDFHRQHRAGLGLRSWLLGCRACPPLKRKRGTGGLPADGPQANLGPERKGGLRDKWEGLANFEKGFRKGFKQWNSNLNLNSSNQK